MRRLYTLILSLLVILCTNEIKAQVNTQDSLALVDLYNSTNGPHWLNNKNWLTAKPLKTWAGIKVDTNRVTSIEMYSNEMDGVLPASLGNLTKTTELNLAENHLTGSIPPEIGNMSGLEILYLYGNQFSGNIPSRIGNLSNLEICELWQNQFSGNIPLAFGKLKKLQKLDLSSNQLSGGIPSLLGNLTNLYYISLGFNQFNGNIPAVLGRLTNLTSLDLRYNQLSGNIPPALSNLKKIGFFLLGNNKLTGTIPSTLSNIKNHNLETLDLSSNELEGHIPTSLGDLSGIEYLRLNNNNLSGEIPSSFNNLQGIKELNLSHNKLSGTVPGYFWDFYYYAPEIDITFDDFTFDGIEQLARNSLLDLLYSNQAAIPVKNFQQNQGTVLSVAAGGTISNNTYKWYRDGNLVSTKIGDSTYIPTSNGNYTVSVTNAIATKLTLYSDTIAIMNLLGKNSNASIEELKNKFSIYPNPVRSITTISFNGTGKTTIKFTDASGNILQTKTVVGKGANILQLDVSKYAAGIYFVSIISEEKPTQTLRLNKE